MTDAQVVACPCRDAHIRLMDLHEDIHRAVEFYLDANEFRRWVNSAIQNSRGVTFLLQKQKSSLRDFDRWYGEWQAQARLNPVLDWGVGARNRIVKEENLRTLSQAVISLYGTRRLQTEETWTVPPEVPVELLASQFSNLARETPARRGKWVQIKRRWFDDQLPEYELVSAIREMHRAVADVVFRAHTAEGVRACDVAKFQRDCVSSEIDPNLLCLGPGDPIPSMVVNAATGEVSTIGFEKIARDEKVLEEGRARYKFVPEPGLEPIEHAHARLQLSKVYLQADGYSGPSLVLFGEGGPRVSAVVFSDQEPRELKIAAAIDAQGAWQFHGAVYSSETWLGLPGSRGSHVPVLKHQLLRSNDEFFDRDPLDDRDEALVVVALTSNGRSKVLMLPFGRVLGGYVFGELIEDDSGDLIPGFLSPIWRRWKSEPAVPDRGPNDRWGSTTGPGSTPAPPTR